MRFEREQYVNELIRREKNGLIKIITGMRRAGKSFLMNTLFHEKLLKQGIPEDQIICFAFDTDEDLDKLLPYLPEEPLKVKDEKGLEKVNARKFRAYIADQTSEKKDYWLLLDEIQELDGFVGTLNGFLRHDNLDVYVTGPNSRMLSSNIVTEFRGRGSVVHLLPLTFREYCSGLSLSTQDAWKEYIIAGGIPIVARMSSENEKNEYLKGLSEETYMKDIIARNHVKEDRKLRELFSVTASCIGSLMSPSSLSKTFKSVTGDTISAETIETYLSYFNDGFLTSRASLYSIKGKSYIDSPFKVYFEDMGVRNAVLNFRQIKETHIMENIIYNELRARGYNVDVGQLSVREKTENKDKNNKPIYAAKNLEVDFIAALGDDKYYLQSTLNMEDEDKRKNEKRSLYGINDSFRKLVITRNGLKPSRDEKGIVTMDLFDFLLDPESLKY